MKKTLVAVAILAASGASFAQATITGNYTFGFVNSTTAANVVSSGLHTDTANVQFMTTEDLGGGLKGEARVSIANAVRSAGTAPVVGEDAYLALSGGFGKVKMGAWEAGQAYDVDSGTGATGIGFDGSVLDANASKDNVVYSMPFGPVTASISYSDYANAVAGAPGDYGTDGGALSQASTGLTVAYAAGPVKARVAYSSYKQQEIAINSKASRYLADVSYDLGVVALGVGVASTKYQLSDASLQTEVQVSAPVGANLSLGLKWASNKDFVKTDVAGAVGTKKSGYDLGASYALSKRTSISAAYLNWTTDGVTGNNSAYRVLVGTSF